MMSEDIEKTQDGREDDAERIVKANAHIKQKNQVDFRDESTRAQTLQVEAEKRFRAIDKFLKKATDDMEKMISSIEDRHITAEEIYTHMGKCEQKRQSFAVLSTYMTAYGQPPQHLLQPFADGPNAEDLKTQVSERAMDPPLLSKDSRHRRMGRRSGIIKRIVDVKKRPHLSTPQSSALEDTATQPSEQFSQRATATSKEFGLPKEIGTSKEIMDDKLKKKLPGTPSTEHMSKEALSKESTTKLENERRLDEEKSGRKRWKVLMKRKKPRSTEEKPGDEPAREVKKRWWQFW